ncbi:hypothetical protein KJK41_12270 [Bacillus haikouensis]|nr:hypothetical protein KJK41_12270 [Bacillus haikouensis]
MESKLNQLKKAMDSTTHQGQHFTEFQKNKIRRSLHENIHAKKNRPHPFLIFTVTALAICIGAIFILTELNSGNLQHNGTPNTSWDIRHEYKKGEKVIFSIFPDPGLQAGKPYNYMFHFTEPFNKFEGKTLSISAIHKDTGERTQVAAPQKITEPSTGYSSLQRFTASFQVPYSGIWKYDVYLDGGFYGDVIVKVDENSNHYNLPDDLPDFVQAQDFEKINWNRKAGSFGRNLIGNENKSGIIGADMPSLTTQKWMWHLWDTDASELTVVGCHNKSKTVHPILNNGYDWTIDLGGENNGADVHAPSAVTIPEKGEWAFLLYTDGELFDVIVLEIDE